MRTGIALSMLVAALPQRLAQGPRERGDVPG
ncbi:hypothetical protein J2W21_003023 [Sinomonas atrocyanea]|nr:hypothetical protein [Sinomonas atrocyanea]